MYSEWVIKLVWEWSVFLISLWILEDQIAGKTRQIKTLAGSIFMHYKSFSFNFMLNNYWEGHEIQNHYKMQSFPTKKVLKNGPGIWR